MDPIIPLLLSSSSPVKSRVLEHVFREVVVRGGLHPARATASRALPGNLVQHRDGMCQVDARYDELLEVDWSVLFDCLERSSGRLEICGFPFYRVEITATVGVESVDGGEVLDLPLEDFDLFASPLFEA